MINRVIIITFIYRTGYLWNLRRKKYSGIIINHPVNKVSNYTRSEHSIVAATDLEKLNGALNLLFKKKLIFIAHKQIKGHAMFISKFISIIILDNIISLTVRYINIRAYGEW